VLPGLADVDVDDALATFAAMSSLLDFNAKPAVASTATATAYRMRTCIFIARSKA
jgi:hypothetical protein